MTAIAAVWSRTLDLVKSVDGEWDIVASMHDNPGFLPREVIVESIQKIGIGMGILTALFLVIFAVLRFSGYGSKEEGVKETDPAKREKAIVFFCWKGSYVLVCFLMNVALAFLGLYHFIYSLPPTSTVQERIEGFKDMAIFAIMQMSYELWALPVGILMVEESRDMLIHHIAMVFVGSMSAFYVNGFRYHNPYMYGLVEISSIPMSIMNFFKANPTLIKAYPDTYTNVRLTFAAFFLMARVIGFTPQVYDYLKLSTMLLWTCRENICRVGWTPPVVGGSVLTVLQYYWAYVIVQSALKFYSKPSSSTEKKEKD